MSVRVFWLEPTNRVKVWLRVYASEPYRELGEATVHEDAPARSWLRKVKRGERSYHSTRSEKIPADHPLWPHPAGEGINRQVWAERLYAGSPDGRLYTLRDAPIGAMWDADWLHGIGGAYVGPDGISLHVRTPGGDWCVDGQASNCTRTQDVDVEGEPGVKRFVRSHYCWVRHGDPRSGEVHVDKNGETCAAGAGSIVIGSYHGFLHNSHLVPC
jgi:hypothetical protein